MTNDSSTSETLGVARIRTRHGLGVWTLVSVWAAIAVVGMACLARYEHRVGARRVAPTVWPTESTIELSADRATLLIFVHPKCPCSRASLDELARLMADCQDRIEAHAIFVLPPEAVDSAAWRSTALRRIAERIEGLQIHWDERGNEAARFAALTSGQVLLYDANGRKRFDGGITASRGHSGDNAGRRSITAIVQAKPVYCDRTEVYGCDLGTTEVEACLQP